MTKMDDFTKGLQAMREMLARFVEQGGNPEIANSMRLNWNPSWGKDPGKPKENKMTHSEVECPSCRGQGVQRGPQNNMPWYPCKYCNETGVVTEQQAIDWPTP